MKNDGQSHTLAHVTLSPLSISTDWQLTAVHQRIAVCKFGVEAASEWELRHVSQTTLQREATAVQGTWMCKGNRLISTQLLPVLLCSRVRQPTRISVSPPPGLQPP